jgi:hypothetical protein
VGSTLVYANSAIMTGELQGIGYTLEGLKDPQHMQVFFIAQLAIIVIFIFLFGLYPYVVKGCKRKGS